MSVRALPVALCLAFLAGACTQQARAAKKLPAPGTKLALKKGEQKAVFAAGCFWCVEAVFERLEGVSAVVSGYAGGTDANAVYKKVASGGTKHAEVVQITYDASKVTYEQLLQVLFSTHDPTTKDRQGPDRGPQYRSAIFYASPEEKKVAEKYIAQINAPEYFGGKVVTTLEPLTKFYPAEDYHQDFVRLNPGHPYVRAWAIPKVDKVNKLFAGMTRE